MAKPRKKFTPNPKAPLETKKNSKGLFSFLNSNPTYFPWIIFIAAFLVYFNSFFNELMMNWDDVGYIVDDERIHSLTINSLMKIFSGFYMSNYHPLTTLTYAIEYHWVGENVFLYHVSNFILHTTNSILVWILVRRLLPDKLWIAAFSALVFAVHPMHVESVAWISERKDLLYSLFFLLGLIQYQKYVTQTTRYTSLLLTFVFFSLSLLSKSAAVIFPLVLLLFDYFNSRKISLTSVLEKIPFFALSFLFGILALRSQQGALQDLDPMLKLYERLLIVVYSLATYVWKFILPLHLSAMYPYPILDDGRLPIIFFFMPLVIVALGFLLFRLRKNKAFVFGILFFLVNLLLVLQFVPVGGVILSERYTYIPYLGLAISMGILIDPFIRSRKSIASFPLLLWIVSLIILSNLRVAVWKNGDVLFTDVIEKYPRLPYAYNNRGYLYWDFYAQKKYQNNEMMKKKYADKAYSDFSMAVALDPRYTEAYLNRAILLYNTGKPAESIQDFDQLLKIDSLHKDGLLGRANTYSTLGMYDKAIPDYQRYLKLFPDAEAKVWVWRGIAFQHTGLSQKALDDFFHAVSIDSTYYESYYWIGIIEYQKIGFSEASVYFKKAYQWNEKNTESLVYLGLCEYNQGNIDLSITYYTEAINNGSTDLSAYVNRAVSYYQKGMYNQALSDLDQSVRGGFPVDQKFYAAVKSQDPVFKRLVSKEFR